jgi:hypothetical protein
MSYDRIRIQSSKYPNGWLERDQAAKMDLREHFKQEFDRLHSQGNRVVLVAGENLCFDELILFENVIDAQEFYDVSFRKRESFLGENYEGCGFQEVSLYPCGEWISTKESAPSRWSGVNYE